MDDGSIPVTEDKPSCTCGSVLVFVKDRREGGLVFWQCWTCGREYVTRMPFRPMRFRFPVPPAE